MKRTHRHQLKENDLARSLTAARDAIQQHRSRIVIALIAAAIIAVGIAAITLWQQRTDAQADALLAEATVILNTRVVPPTTEGQAPGELPAAATMGAEGSFPSEAARYTAALPRLEATVDAYPDTPAGITARYYYAAALGALGRHDESIQAFDEVVDRAGTDSLYGRMARFGKADTQMRAGQIDASIATWQELATSADESLPQDAILMELARAYVAKGNEEEARRTFAQIVQEHPMSPYSAEARAEMGNEPILLTN
jgi:tetratricopeptide (TPR) repeat protein